MRTTLMALSVCVAPLLLASCRLDFDAPPSSPPGSEVDPAPYLGTWELLTIGGHPISGPCQVVVSRDTNGVLTATAVIASVPKQPELAQLTTVNGETIASLNPREGTWHLLNVTLFKGGTHMLAKLPNGDLVLPDIKNGVIAGSVSEYDAGRHSLRVLATASDLRAYLSTSTSIFSNTNLYFRLQKSP